MNSTGGEPVLGAPNTGAIEPPVASVPGTEPLSSNPLARLEGTVAAALEAVTPAMTPGQTPEDASKKALFDLQFGSGSTTPSVDASNPITTASDVATGSAPDLDTTPAGLPTASSDVVQPPVSAETPTLEVTTPAQSEAPSDLKGEFMATVDAAFDTAFDKLKKEEEIRTNR